ncbi:glycerol-3-phosphate acyltransferase RAM2-like [Primulina tabacum]|uniref:glycerol-3-phosphate acyltransferase RAM2-like n=1 Tax=Primulina tabacum TaxID=48773 RepID=UPI003F59083C
MGNPSCFVSGKIPSISECSTNDRENHTVVSDLDGTLLVGRSSFPYFALVAFDVGGILRLFILLLAAPLAGILYYLISEAAGIRVLIFVTVAGVKVSDIESAARAVLPKYYSDDVHPETFGVFSSCGRRCVVTANPRIMVEPFLKKHLNVDMVLGTEISSFRGIATGLVASPGVLVGKNKAVAVERSFGRGSMPDIGIGDRETDLPFMELCKERYMVPSRVGVRPMKPDMLPKPVIFHDGRLVQKPTPMVALAIVLWFPIGILLAIIRIILGALFPLSVIPHVTLPFGVIIKTKGHPFHNSGDRNPKVKKAGGMVFATSHRCVLDAVIISTSLGSKSITVSYSVPSTSEWLSPMKTARLTRDRAKDAKLMRDIVKEGRYLVMCPEGTTCREPYLLRFSSLFAEISDQITPVATTVKTTMFYGNTARGYKWLDPIFFTMNPFPTYEVAFLNKLPYDQTCSAGKSAHEVANHVQELIAEYLQYKCTNLTRKDKYLELAGTDGTVGKTAVEKLKKDG